MEERSKLEPQIVYFIISPGLFPNNLQSFQSLIFIAYSVSRSYFLKYENSVKSPDSSKADFVESRFIARGQILREHAFACPPPPHPSPRVKIKGNSEKKTKLALPILLPLRFFFVINSDGDFARSTWEMLPLAIIVSCQSLTWCSHTQKVTYEGRCIMENEHFSLECKWTRKHHDSCTSIPKPSLKVTEACRDHDECASGLQNQKSETFPAPSGADGRTFLVKFQLEICYQEKDRGHLKSFLSYWKENVAPFHCPWGDVPK